MGDAQLDLVHDERPAHRALEQLHLPGRVIRDAEIQHLPCTVQDIESLGDLVGLDESVGAVQQHDIEIVGPQRVERFVDGTQDVLLGEVPEA